MCVEARRPHNWKHAELGEIKTFLENDISKGVVLHRHGTPGPNSVEEKKNPDSWYFFFEQIPKCSNKIYFIIQEYFGIFSKKKSSWTNRGRSVDSPIGSVERPIWPVERPIQSVDRVPP